MDAADVSVPTSEGETLAARFFWPRDLRVSRTAKGLPALLASAANGAATLIVHQYSVMGGSQELMRGIARELAFRQGCVAVTFDLRGVGGSSGRCTLTGHREAEDVETMGKWLQEEGFSRILLLCTSAGAPIGGSALDRVPAFTGCAARAAWWRRPLCVQRSGVSQALTARAFRAMLRSYVALGYVFGFWASILFSGHYRAVLDSTKPKLFIQARRPHCIARRAWGLWDACALTATPRRRAQGSRDEFTAPSKLLEVRGRAPSACGPRGSPQLGSFLSRRVGHSGFFSSPPLAAPQWAVPQSKSAVTETRIIPDMGHFQARPGRAV